MFERFTDQARRVVVLAQEEARLLNHDYVGTEHLLLGLAHEGQGVAAKALEQLGIRLEALRSQVQEVIGQGQRAPSGHVPFTPRAKKVLELSLREAKQLRHGYIGTEHLLLGLVREGEGVAAQVLIKLGGDLSRVPAGDPAAERLRRRPTGGGRGTTAGAHAHAAARGAPGGWGAAGRGAPAKEAAIEAQDFDRAAALRDAEEELLAGLAEREREGTAGVDLAVVLHEVRRLHGEVERLRGEVQGLRELLAGAASSQTAGPPRPPEPGIHEQPAQLMRHRPAAGGAWPRRPAAPRRSSRRPCAGGRRAQWRGRPGRPAASSTARTCSASSSPAATS